MKMPMGNLWKRLENRFQPAVGDVGTSFLGIAALFFVRAFPPSASVEFNLWLLGSSVVFFLLGIWLRVAYRTGT